MAWVRTAGTAAFVVVLVAGPVAAMAPARPAPALPTPHGASPEVAAAAPHRPFPQHVRYARGVIGPAVPAAQRDATVRRLWSAWKRTYLRSAGSGGTWVRYNSTDSTVSEAIGYGMILAAYFGERPLFDELLRYFREHPSSGSPDLMAWKQSLVAGRMTDVAGRSSATDGDLDIGYGLLLAHRQWGSAEVDYRAAFRRVTRAVLDHDVNRALGTTTPGDWAVGTDARHTRTSDFMPAHAIAFAAADPARARQWRRVNRTLTAIVMHQYRNGSRRTGLMPDFMVKRPGGWVPVPGTYLESPHDGDFNYNACRTPWRLSLPRITLGRTGLARPLRTQARWLRTSTGGRPERIMAGYFVRNGPNGTPFVDYTDLAFSAPALVNAMLGKGPAGRRWVNRLYRHVTAQPDTTNYYNDSLRLMALLVVGRNWWQP